MVLLLSRRSCLHCLLWSGHVNMTFSVPYFPSFGQGIFPSMVSENRRYGSELRVDSDKLGADKMYSFELV